MEFVEIVSDVCLLYFIVDPLVVKRSESLESWSHWVCKHTIGAMLAAILK